MFWHQGKSETGRIGLAKLFSCIGAKAPSRKLENGPEKISNETVSMGKGDESMPVDRGGMVIMVGYILSVNGRVS